MKTFKLRRLSTKRLNLNSQDKRKRAQPHSEVGPFLNLPYFALRHFIERLAFLVSSFLAF
ncbi:hypothetical protein BCU72_15065 [Vibrio cyclitrophicus]|nr:hypothetical protein BCU72_15065 [Vibrio cyclitrophicus]